MSTNRRWTILAAVLLSTSLLASPAVADQHCKKVRANVTALGEFLVDDPVCAPYDFCQSAEIRGTLNGTLWGFGYWVDQDFDAADGTAEVWNLDDILDTNKGQIWAEERAVVNALAADGYAAHIAFNGGTGRYVDATGWITTTLTFYPFTGGKIAGEICY